MATELDMGYQLFKVSQDRYQKNPSVLSDQERKTITKICEQKARIEQAVLQSQEATKIAVSSDQVQSAMDEVLAKYESKDDFVNDIKNIDLTENDFCRAVSRELHVDAVMDYVGSKMEPVKDVDVSLFYYMNINKFKRPETRVARHILVTINDDNPENTRDASLAKINLIHNRLVKKTTRFEEQALKHSECPTSLQGGLLGEVKKGVLYPELEEVLFSLREQKLSDVVESEIGFHILRCDEIKPEGIVPYKEVFSKLKSHLEEKNRKQIQKQWLESLMQYTSIHSKYGEVKNA